MSNCRSLQVLDLSGLNYEKAEGAGPVVHVFDTNVGYSFIRGCRQSEPPQKAGGPGIKS